MRRFLLLLSVFVSLSHAGEIRAYYNPGCGCYLSYFSKLEKEGFKVKRIRVSPSELDMVKERLKVPLEARSCHTMEHEGRFIEGHVPPEGVRKALSDKNIGGVSAPHGFKSARGGFEDSYIIVRKEVKP